MVGPAASRVKGAPCCPTKCKALSLLWTEARVPANAATASPVGCCLCWVSNGAVCCVLCAGLCCAVVAHPVLQGKPTMVFPGQNFGFPRSWFIVERTRTTGGCVDLGVLCVQGLDT